MTLTVATAMAGLCVPLRNSDEVFVPWPGNIRYMRSIATPKSCRCTP